MPAHVTLLVHVAEHRIQLPLDHHRAVLGNLRHCWVQGVITQAPDVSQP